jgi:hypothetical protein
VVVNGAPVMGVVLIMTTIFFYGILIYLTVMSYIWFASGEDCMYNKVFIIGHCISFVIITGLTIARIHPQGSVLTAGGVCLYVWFLSW